VTFEKMHMRGATFSVFTDLYKLVNGLKNVEKVWVLYIPEYVRNK
jgi:hypothetical protein